MKKLALLLAVVLMLLLPVAAFPKTGTVLYVAKEVVIWPFRCVRALLKLPAYLLDGNFHEWVTTDP